MPKWQVSLASNIYPMMLSSPQEWNACAHSVATHDSQQSKSFGSESN